MPYFGSEFNADSLIFQLTEEIAFPHPSYAEADGLLAVGGDLHPERLLLAYEHGIFPWYNPGDPILWYAPDPRFVIFPHNIKVRKSMQQWLRKTKHTITENQAFKQVISACREINREDQHGTWIGDDMQEAYTLLHKLGFAKSIEVWIEGELVGGLYGVELNNCFFGESMFSKVSNTSKAALIHLCQNKNYKVIDCQMETAHLKSMGGELIPLDELLEMIQQ